MALNKDNLKREKVPFYDYVLKQDYTLFLNSSHSFSDLAEKAKPYLNEINKKEKISIFFKKFLKDEFFNFSFNEGFISFNNPFLGCSVLNLLTFDSCLALTKKNVKEEQVKSAIDNLKINSNVVDWLKGYIIKEFDLNTQSSRHYTLSYLNNKEKESFVDALNEILKEIDSDFILEVVESLELKLKKKLLEENIEMVLKQENISYYQMPEEGQKRSDYYETRELCYKELNCLYMVENDIDLISMMNGKKPKVKKLFLLHTESKNKKHPQRKKLFFYDSLELLKNKRKEHHEISPCLTIRYSLSRSEYEKVETRFFGDYILFDNQKDAENFFHTKLMSIRNDIDFLLKPKFIF